MEVNMKNKFILQDQDLVHFTKGSKVIIDRTELDLVGLYGVVKYVNKDNDTFDLDNPTDSTFRVDFKILKLHDNISDPHTFEMLREFSQDHYNSDDGDIIPIEYNDYDDELIYDMITNEQRLVGLVMNLQSLPY
jgi:hypothetical protein